LKRSLEELNVIERNRSGWELVELPVKKHAIVVKCVFKGKFRLDGSMANQKPKLVAKSYLQMAG